MQYKEEVKAAIAGLDGYREAEAYFDGTVLETFATAKVRRALKVSGEAGGPNYCKTVVETVVNRLELASIQATAGQEIDNQLFEAGFSLDVAEIHRKALIFGGAYALVWPNDEGEAEVTYLSPLTTTLIYDPENPKRKLACVRLWIQDGKARLNIMTGENVYRLQAQGEQVTEDTNWTLLETVENPFGEIPVFHFRTARPYGKPEHYSAYPLQNAITKAFVNSLVASDYQSAPQRYALSKMGGADVDLNDFDESKTDRENVGSLKNGPGELWYLKGIDAVGQFNPADPDVFWTAIEKSVRAMASITSTPLHYFELKTNISGESFRAAESPHLKKVKDRQASFGATWREVLRFLLKINGIESDVVIGWVPNESLDELDRWRLSLLKINAGLSHKQALIEGGYTAKAADRILAERTAEAAAGLYYERKPTVRVNTSSDENTPKDVA